MNSRLNALERGGLLIMMYQSNAEADSSRVFSVRPSETAFHHHKPAHYPHSIALRDAWACCFHSVCRSAPIKLFCARAVPHHSYFSDIACLALISGWARRYEAASRCVDRP